MISWKKDTIQQEQGGGLELELKYALGCVYNAEEHGRPARSIQKDDALHAKRRNLRMPTGMTLPNPDIFAC